MQKMIRVKKIVSICIITTYKVNDLEEPIYFTVNISFKVLSDPPPECNYSATSPSS